jgi:hypothetical protein
VLHDGPAVVQRDGPAQRLGGDSTRWLGGDSMAHLLLAPASMVDLRSVGRGSSKVFEGGMTRARQRAAVRVLLQNSDDDGAGMGSSKILEGSVTHV